MKSTDSARPPVAWELVALIVAGLVIRMAVGQVMPTDDAYLNRLPDQKEYLELARNLDAGKGLSFFDSRFGDRVYAYRAPLYPMVLAACGANVRVAREVGAVIDASTILAVWLLARRWLSRRGAAVAAALVAFNPILIYFSGLLLSETLFTALLAWGMALLSGRNWRARVCGCCVLAISALDRPSGMALGPILALVAIDGWRDRVAWAGVAILATAAAVLPWGMRNRSAIGQWIFTATNAGITLYDGLNPAATGASDQRFVSAMPELRQMGEATRSEYLAGMAWDYAKLHPDRAAKLAVSKIARTWSPWPLSAEYGRPAYMAVIAAYTAPLFVLTLVGIGSVIARGRRIGIAPGFSRAAAILCLMPALYFTLVHAVTVGSMRYRVPADVPMAVVAASAVVGRGRDGRGRSPA